MAWELLSFETLIGCSVAAIIFVFVLVLFVNHVVQRQSLPHDYTTITLVLYTFFLEMPFIVCLEAGVLGMLRERHLIAERIPSWLIALNVGLVCGGGLVAIIGVICDGRRRARRQHAGQHSGNPERAGS